MIRSDHAAALPLILALAGLFPFQALAGSGQWARLGLSDQSVNSVAFDAFDPAKIYVASAGGLFESADRGSTWANFGGAQFVCGNANSVFSDSQHPGVLFASSWCVNPSTFSAQGGLYKSTDLGANWSLVLPKGVFVKMAPGNSSVACAGAIEFVYLHPYVYVGSVSRSTDNGGTWGNVLGPFSDNPISSVVFAPSDPSIVYAGFAVDAFREPGVGVFKSTDTGQSWAALPDVGLPTNAVTALAVDPDDPEKILAGVDTLGLQTSARGVFRSTDGGATWMQSDAGLESVTAGRPFLYDPRDSTRVYAVTSGGVFRSTDGGQSWLPMNDGLENVTLNTLGLDSSGTALYAGTSAGVYAFEPATAFGCAPDANTLCLNNGRFQVQASWTNFQGNSGLANVVPGASSGDSGVMWFFGPDNWELLIKVLNGCGVNGHYWVFGAAATDVAYVIQVTDTLTGEVKTYTNPLGNRAAAITDAAAFEACP